MSDLTPRFRPVLGAFPAYKPGKAPVVVTGQAHKLSSNESPYGPLPSVLEVLAVERRAHRQRLDGGQDRQ